jgi:hypothetical protein
MLTDIMLQMCGFATINRGDWISINTLVVLLMVTIAALVYAVGSFFPPERREKIKGVARYEIVEAIISVFIIITLILFASFACNAGGELVGQNGYSGVFNAADGYVGGLLFTNGLSVMSNLYIVSTQYEVASSFFFEGGDVSSAALSKGLEGLAGMISGPLKAILGAVSFEIPLQGATFFIKLSVLFSTVYGAMMDTSFGGLFILFLMLKIIEASALTVVAPVAILMRSLSFTGPQLRRTSNLFLAIAIGFYFVLPLMILLNAYVASCLNLGTAGTCSYPYFSAYLQGYKPLAPQASLFTTGTTVPLNSQMLPSFASGFSLPLTFYSAAFPGGFGQLMETIINGGGVALQYGTQVAGYLFMGIVLIALDLGVTAGFIVGITKGLDAIGSGNAFGGGPFFGG